MKDTDLETMMSTLNTHLMGCKGFKMVTLKRKLSSGVILMLHLDNINTSLMFSFSTPVSSIIAHLKKQINYWYMAPKIKHSEPQIDFTNDTDCASVW